MGASRARPVCGSTFLSRRSVAVWRTNEPRKLGGDSRERQAGPGAAAFSISRLSRRITPFPPAEEAGALYRGSGPVFLSFISVLLCPRFMRKVLGTLLLDCAYRALLIAWLSGLQVYYWEVVKLNKLDFRMLILLFHWLIPSLAHK